MRRQTQRRPSGRRLTAMGVAAVISVALLAGTALAAASPTLRAFFTREWGSRTDSEITPQHALLLDSLTQQVGEQMVSGGVTVTVDSITAGSDSIWALLDVEGLKFNDRDHYSFMGTDVEILPDPADGKTAGASYSLGSIGLTESGAVRMLLQFSGIFPTGNQINGGGYTLELRLQDLCRCGERRNTVLAEGAWNFSIPLAVEALPPEVVLPDTVVEGPGGEIPLTELRLTVTSLKFLSDIGLELPDITVLLADGTALPAAASGGSRLEDGRWFHTIQWPVPLDLTQVEALYIGTEKIQIP